MQTKGIGLRVDGHRLHAKFFTGADHPQRDFSTIGDQDFLEHALTPVRR